MASSPGKILNDFHPDLPIPKNLKDAPLVGMETRSGIKDTQKTKQLQPETSMDVGNYIAVASSQSVYFELASDLKTSRLKPTCW